MCLWPRAACDAAFSQRGSWSQAALDSRFWILDSPCPSMKNFRLVFPAPRTHQHTKTAHNSPPCTPLTGTHGTRATDTQLAHNPRTTHRCTTRAQPTRSARATQAQTKNNVRATHTQPCVAPDVRGSCNVCRRRPRVSNCRMCTWRWASKLANKGVRARIYAENGRMRDPGRAHTLT